MEFNKKLIALRHAKGLSQKQLSDSLHLSPTTIQHWENGLSTPDMQQLSTLADFFDLPLTLLIKDTCPPLLTGASTASTALSVNPERHRIITQFEILSGTLAGLGLLGALSYFISAIF